ncbi:hypothetical protein COB55_03060 [Candidatus Wolfebacteria bacterium]|nr:MAG: hypothetical protein COB55_03060 [Candidatus Wolfebacteria bacterium]
MVGLPNTEDVPSVSLVPDGDYNCEISKSEVRDTKSGGEQVIFSFKITEGEYKNSIIRHSLNMVNHGENKAKTEEIALQHLKQIQLAVDRPKERESEKLHGITLNIKTEIYDDEYYGEKRNKITAFRRFEGETKKEPTDSPFK